MDGIDSSLIDQLEETVESRHRSVLRAIKTLRDYLSENRSASDGTDPVNPVFGELVGYLRGKGSIRERVRRAILGEFKSIEEIADETGLTDVQVRGVVYAKDFRVKLQRDRSSGPTMRFRLAVNGGE
jgi:hypothetical protein